MRLGKMFALVACLSMPYGKGYVNWTWPVLTPACLDTEYSRMSHVNVKNRKNLMLISLSVKNGGSVCLKRTGGIPSVTDTKFLLRTMPELVPAMKRKYGNVSQWI